jgi:flagellar motor protein MotB
MYQLLLKDVSLYRLKVKGEGESIPIVKDAKTEAEHQKNRRVEILKLN